METFLELGIVFAIGLVLWKVRRFIWALLLFAGALLVVVSWEGMKAASPEFAALLTLGAAVLAAWRYAKARV